MKKVGKLNGKVVVVGDKNLVTANQIHYEEKDGNITLSERKGGELNSVTGSGNNTNQINILDVMKNPRFVCVINDTSGSDSGLGDLIVDAGATLVPCVIYNRKRGTGITVVLDIMSNEFKGFPIYAVFDYDTPDVFGMGKSFGLLVDEVIQDYPADGYYITKDEFLKAWNEAAYY